MEMPSYNEVLRLEDKSSSNSSSTNTSHLCRICDAPSNGYHFNAPSCSACAAFFRRTVTLNKVFQCFRSQDCHVHFTLRVICRACRYNKCILMGMDRLAVQPRRDSNAGRRKILYAGRLHISHSQTSIKSPNTTIPLGSPEAATAPYSVFSSSVIGDDVPSPSTSLSYSSAAQTPSTSFGCTPDSVLNDLLQLERLHNERRKILYCAHSSISNLLTCSPTNDIPYDVNDMKILTFAGISKDIRAQILVIYEWMRGWQHFPKLGTQDKKCFLRRCILYHTILDPAYLTIRLGLPERFVMFNGMYVGIKEDSEEGWLDEADYISAEMKKKLYRPLLNRVVNEIAYPMKAIQLSFTEFLFLKALVSFKSASASDISAPIKDLMVNHINMLFRALHHHYLLKLSTPEEIAKRMGNVVLLMSSVYAVGMECLESHQKIQFFDLWQLDDLLLKLISTQHK
ncbi:unnamed protein product [Auanema sp. JU1783]|nr:unnamed protein product [Auanema sp. JU1783]